MLLASAALFALAVSTFWLQRVAFTPAADSGVATNRCVVQLENKLAARWNPLRHSAG